MTLRPRRPLTLTARLVAVVVLLVAVTALLIGTATTLAMQRSLDQRLDADVRDAARFAAGPRHPDRDGDDFGPGQQFGSLQAYRPDSGASRGRCSRSRRARAVRVAHRSMQPSWRPWPASTPVATRRASTCPTSAATGSW